MNYSRRQTILFVDDDGYGASVYVHALEAIGFVVKFASDVETALEWGEDDSFAAIVIDIMMPPGEFFTQLETAGGYKTGIALGREMRDRHPETPLFALTNSREADVESWYSVQPEYGYFFKGDYTPEEFATVVKNKVLGIPDLPKCFIVHGHDANLRMALKNYLQNTLGFPEPVVLAEQPSLGMTIIEKFEHYAADRDLVFAIFTADDFKHKRGGRARQNVVFEYGYFLGMIGRRSGRVFLLYDKGTEIPSDLLGVVYIDVSNGIEAAGEAIRKELRGLV
ncbi:MAG: hypothetical protein AMXMBFR36_29270 [Acidobacteriota bacterium]